MCSGYKFQPDRIRSGVVCQIRKESEDMKKMRYAEAIIDGYNALSGAVIAVLSYFLGEHWMLFLAFLLLNVGD